LAIRGVLEDCRADVVVGVEVDTAIELDQLPCSGR